MPITLVSGPASEPVTLAEVKLQARIIDDSEDSLLSLLITAARTYAEMYCDRSFITQTWRMTLDAFPGPSLMGVPMGLSYSLPGHAILLERGPVQAVSSITYLDMGGTTQTMPSNQYAVDLSGPVARITPRFGMIWPIALPQIGAVQVDYVAGYGANAAAVPAGIKHWILMRVATLYENREQVAQMDRGKIEPLPFVDGLLDPYRTVRL